MSGYLEDLKYNKGLCKGKGPILCYLKPVGFCHLCKYQSDVVPHQGETLAKLKLLDSGMFFYFQATKQMTQKKSHRERKKLLSFPLLYTYVLPTMTSTCPA